MKHPDTFTLGGDLEVRRLGFGAMRITGRGIWGEAPDPAGGPPRPGPGIWERDCRPERLKRCCEDSLRRLRLERIDLYQLHAVDPNVPVEDSVGALAELKSEIGRASGR